LKRKVEEEDARERNEKKEREIFVWERKSVQEREAAH